MSGGRLAALSLVTVSVLFMSGCSSVFGSGTRDFSPVSAPTWEPGFEWSYTTEVSSEFTGFLDGVKRTESEEAEHETTFRVINTTQPLGPESVYYVLVDGEPIDPFSYGKVQALTKADLTLVGMSWNYAEPKGPPPSAKPSGEPTCYAAPSEITVVPEDSRIELLDFGLAQGKTWSGVLGEAPFAMKYVASVKGMDSVKTPAGTFDGIHVVVDMQFLSSGAAEAAGYEFAGRYEVWYGPDVRWIVKRSLDMDARGVIEGQQFEASIRMSSLLTDYALTPGPATPAPRLAEPTKAAKYAPSVGIVSDTQLPVNLAESMPTVRFTLEELAPYTYQGNQIKYRSTLPSQPVLDPKDYSIEWRVSRPMSDGEPVVGNGAFIDVVLDRGGQYQVEADIRRLTCDVSSVDDPSAWFTTYWQKDFMHDVPPIQTGASSVGFFPVDSTLAEGIVTWEMDPRYLIPVDSGRPIIETADGFEVDWYQTDVNEMGFMSYWEGQHELFWDPDNLPVGDGVMIRVRVDYPTFWH